MLTLAKEDFRWKVFTLASLTTTTDDFSDFYRLVDTRNYKFTVGHERRNYSSWFIFCSDQPESGIVANVTTRR